MEYTGRCTTSNTISIAKVVITERDLRIYFSDSLGSAVLRGYSDDGSHYVGICDYKTADNEVRAKFDLRRENDNRLELVGCWWEGHGPDEPWVITLEPIPGTENVGADD